MAQTSSKAARRAAARTRKMRAAATKAAQKCGWTTEVRSNGEIVIRR